MSEYRYQRMFEAAQDGIMLVNADTGRIEDANPSLIRLLGYSHAELLGKRLWQVVSPQHQAEWQEMFASLQTTGHIRREHFPLRTRGGTRIDVELLVNVYDCEGVEVIQCNLRNISERRSAEKFLQDSERRYRRLIENSPDIVYTYSSKRGGIYYSSKVNSILGYSVEHLLSHPWLWNTSIHPDDLVKVTLAIQACQRTGAPLRMEYRIIDAAGKWHWFYDRAIDSRVEDGDFIIEGLAMDITDRRLAQTRLAYLTRVHAVLSGINSLIVRVTDRDELFRESCRIAVESAGFCMAMLAVIDHETGKVAPVASAGKSEDLMSDVRSTLASDQTSSATMVSRAIREKRAIVSNKAVDDPQLSMGSKYTQAGVRSLVVLPLMVEGHAHGVLALYATESDFFHREELNLLQQLAANVAFAIDHVDKQERLNYLAYYDVLTGLANRSLFLERVAQYMRSAKDRGHMLAIGLFDLERFRNINDSLGRAAGDTLLKKVAEWLALNVGNVSLLARIDVDHFALVLPKIRQRNELTAFVESTIEALQNKPFQLDDAVLRITAKVGVALFPKDGASADILFRNAEAALKQAKASGDHYLLYTEQMTANVASKLTLENQLRQALDHGQFALYYQPKVNLASGKVTSVEALIRWNDPVIGLMLPDQFISVLEETGLISEVGRWALHQAAEDYLRWLDKGLAAVRIAVNVSALQLRHRDFIDEIAKVVASDARLAVGLELEITESLLMADVRQNTISLQAIRAMGVSIAIDDFGTGFSSLSYLAQLPLDVLKIDRSFVIDMTASPQGLSLVATIINLAHSLKLNVVAEGVETEEQLRLLRQLGCDEMQGYLFSKPVPIEIFETLFLSGNTHTLL